MGGISHLKIRVQSTEFRVQSSDLFRSFLPWWYHDGFACCSCNGWIEYDLLLACLLVYIALENKGLFSQKCLAW